MDSGRVFSFLLGEHGQLVLPAQLRRRLDVREGDRLIAILDAEGGVRLVSAREQIRKLGGAFADLEPDRQLVDELLAERRAEADRECSE